MKTMTTDNRPQTTDGQKLTLQEHVRQHRWQYLAIIIIGLFGFGAGMQYNSPGKFGMQCPDSIACYAYCTFHNSTPQMEICNTQENLCKCDRRLKTVYNLPSVQLG